MENRFMNGCKKLLFAAVIMISLLSVAPKNVNAAKKEKMDQKKVTCTAKERFTLNVKGTSKKATWTSSNKAIATVTKKGGNVVTKRAGKVTITATVGSKKVKCKVTVKKSAPKPFLTATSKTLRVGESFLLIEGQYTNYESTFSFNDRIATIDPYGRVVAKGVGTTTVMVNCGVKNGKYLDYTCKITVVAGSAPTCKHQWMDTSKYKASGVWGGPAFMLKTARSEVYMECKGCHEKFLDSNEFYAHVDKFVNSHDTGNITAGGGENHNMVKFEDYRHYCSKCGECKY